MSIFSSIAKVGGKVLGTIGKTAINVAGNVVGVGTIIPSATTQAATAPAPTAQTVLTNVDGVNAGTGLLGALTNALNGAGDWFSGKTHTQSDVNFGSQSSSGSMPSWLLPAGLGLGALLLFSSMSGSKRRY